MPQQERLQFRMISDLKTLTWTVMSVHKLVYKHCTCPFTSIQLGVCIQYYLRMYKSDISTDKAELVSTDKQNKRGFGTGHIHRCSSHLRWGKHTWKAPSGNAVNDIQKARSQNGDWTDFMQDSP